MKQCIIKIGMASCGRAAGAEEIYKSAEDHINKHNLDCRLMKTACIGMCFAEPLIEFIMSDMPDITYGRVTSEEISGLIDSYLAGKPQEEKVIISRESTSNFDIQGQENDSLKKQTRIVLRNCGIIDPESIEDYINRQGYMALQKALKEMDPEKVVQEILASRLRGRGGAGFPTGLKWEIAANSRIGEKKYIVCNADEGDPGAFMDRSVLEGDPHSVIEGMLIGAFAIGADEGYIYVRAEYPLAIKHLKKAINDAYERNLLGKNILNSSFSFDLHIKEGAGAFVCGEETALIASIEGKRGMPNIRPPYPAESGLFGQPTNINNVETFANIAWIILNGSEAFNKLGTERSKGTKVFALAGKIKKSGLIEVPMGVPLRHVIYDIGGGMKENSPFKAVQLGGPSGGCIPASKLDTIVDYDSINQTGAIMGSGGMVVMDEKTCVVDVAKFFLTFTQNESCGKCTFCRIGTRRMLEILTRITEGKGKIEDIKKLEDLAEMINKGSLCGLGQTAPNPVLTTLKYFREEYEEHIIDKKCRAGVCNALINYSVLADKCVGCTACARVCPVQCISGEVKKPHFIHQNQCIRCGACFNACKFEAIVKK
ncbi:MAG TPA: NADH-quinone oxidoreductase subunit NuoF [Candidatus Cloacimonadota bacterium]|nr:NADH-quinone oxidoreductase subunit NuoF [Candidatus Cloacimonadota bacterium]HOQ79830.1 NADH-quinone oxidoreductase subunit NuoF [Candidatus Cloacimonadota bacterium]